ncbi:hypothetical protein L228DRAFT_270794 [Xylona heveae TC161]|uniref:Uncharacterized protein n=1 Tax=Xylona heveae (strain CBS 132557 / TC161) TaxID=1328760 RepID=A0A165A6V5_XYLHT|nr:hypothetical protein L228DRAFT_270794 [Xylona heveae TC161]KZF20036.1 hypothetical protein L228DRAFT_270794 [Xylona heveae TC161]
MASARVFVSIPRFLLPRGVVPVRPSSLSSASPQQQLIRHSGFSRGYASSRARATPSSSSSGSSGSSSSSSGNNQRLLEKPTRFNPPSHPARLPSRRSMPRSYPGPPLSAGEQQAQQTRKYPHMMPTEGTFMHWFLTNQLLHLWITLGTLLSLAFFTFMSNFKERSPYADLLPAGREYFSHPLQTMGRLLEIYKLQMAYNTEKSVARREAISEDAYKRSEYLKAHGLENEGRFGGWSAREDRRPASLKPLSSSSDPEAAAAASAPAAEAEATADESKPWRWSRLIGGVKTGGEGEGQAPQAPTRTATAVSDGGDENSPAAPVTPEDNTPRELTPEEKKAAEDALIKAQEEEEDRRIALSIWGRKQ